MFLRLAGLAGPVIYEKLTEAIHEALEDLSDQQTASAMIDEAVEAQESGDGEPVDEEIATVDSDAGDD